MTLFRQPFAAPPRRPLTAAFGAALCAFALQAQPAGAAEFAHQASPVAADTVQQFAQDVVRSADAEGRTFGIIDKPSATLWIFDAQGRHDAAGWLERVKPLAKPNEAVIVICRTGNRTKPVSQFLSQQAGYTTVYNVKHGIKGWIGAGGAVEPATQSIASCKAGKTC